MASFKGAIEGANLHFAKKEKKEQQERIQKRQDQLFKLTLDKSKREQAIFDRQGKFYDLVVSGVQGVDTLGTPAMPIGGAQGVGDDGLPVLRQADGVPTPTAQTISPETSSENFQKLLSDPAFLFAAKQAGIDLTQIASLEERRFAGEERRDISREGLEERKRRNIEVHEEATLRIDEAKRRNDIAQAGYERGFFEWSKIETKNAAGQKVTRFVPKFLKPGQLGLGGEIVTAPPSGDIKPQVLPPSVRTEVATLQVMVDELNFIKDNAKPGFVGAPGIGKTGALKVAGFVPFDISDPDFAVWSMKFESLKAIERHEKFGAAFTSTEKVAFKKMFPSEIRSFKDFLAQIDATIDFVEGKKSTILKTHAAPRKDLLNSLGTKKKTLQPKTAEEYLKGL